MSNLKYRILAIAVMLVASAWFLFPRTTVERIKRDGVFVYDTVKRVPLKRGLDLKGGMHMSLEIDDSKQAVTDKADALERALKVVRTRIDEFGVSEPLVQKVGNERIIVELPGIDDPRRAEEIVQQQAFLAFHITDETNSLERVRSRIDQMIRGRGGVAAEADVNKDKAPQTGLTELLTKADTGAKGDSARTDTSAAAPGAAGTGPFSRLIQPTNFPGEYIVSTEDYPRVRDWLELPEVQAVLPPGKVLRWGNDSLSFGAEPVRTFYVLDARPIITGEYLVNARPNSTPIEGTVVEFELSNVGGRVFRTETGKHVQDYMAIVLDNRVMGRPPVIQQAIGTRGQITLGGQDLQAAQDLALVLRAGSLPVPLRIAEIRNIGASLGADAIRQGLSAGALGVALVIVIMIAYYRFSGFLAVCGLAFYAVTTLAVLAAFGATLTLPGLAGFVLSIGMAVDANFLIFERIREELDRGKTIRTAIDEGFNHAWSAIIDTHVTTALTAAILYQFGTGPVRGFAVALLAGIASSLVSAIFVVRTLYLLWLSRNRAAQALSI
jgi:preprotein translocase subunit SecD